MRTRVRRWLLRISAISAAWATLLIFTGGVYYRTAAIRISSRNWRLPFALALCLLALAWPRDVRIFDMKAEVR